MKLRSGTNTKKNEPSGTKEQDSVRQRINNGNEEKEGRSVRGIEDSGARVGSSTKQIPGLSWYQMTSLTGLESTDPITELQECKVVIENSLRRDRKQAKRRRISINKVRNSTPLAADQCPIKSGAPPVQSPHTNDSIRKSKHVARGTNEASEPDSNSPGQNEAVDGLGPLIFNSPELHSWEVDSSKLENYSCSTTDSLSYPIIDDSLLKRVWNPTESLSMKEEIEDFYNDFPGLSGKYTILRKIGEGMRCLLTICMKS